MARDETESTRQGYYWCAPKFSRQEPGKRFFLLGELDSTNENLGRLMPIARCFNEIILRDKRNNPIDNSYDIPLKTPLTNEIRFSRDCSQVYLCFDGWTEGREIMFYGEMIVGQEKNGHYEIESGSTAEGVSLRDLVVREVQKVSGSDNLPKILS